MHQNEPLIIYFIDIKTDFRDYNGKTNFVFILQLSLKKKILAICLQGNTINIIYIIPA